MAFTFTQLRSMLAEIFTNDAPDGTITPEIDRTTRNDLIDTIEQAIEDIPEGPQGAQGVQGIQGVPGPVGPAGLIWEGAWAALTTYAEDDAVGYGGASYFNILAIAGNASNPNPATDTTHWALLAAQGAQGQTGAQGPQGAQGPAGTSGSSAVYKAILTQTSGGGVTASILINSLGVDVDYTTQSTGSYGITPSDFGNYSCSVSNLSATKTVKCSGYITGFSGTFKQFDLSGTAVANFTDVYIEIRPLNA